MRRADDRRSASVMIKSSIRWSLVGNDVDWMMKASEPRTFSWISTKISMSAKRRITALASVRPSPWAISCASAGLELPATSLIEPFLADIDASPRALLETMFSISVYPRNRRVSTSEVISRRGLGWQPVASGFPAQNQYFRTILLMAALLMAPVRQRTDAEFTRNGCKPVRACHRGAAPARCGGRRHVRRRSIDHGAKPAQSGLRDLPQHQVVGGGPGVASGLAGRFLAAEPQGTLLVAVVDIPDPCDHGAAAADLGGEIASHAVRGRAFAGNDREVAKLRFAVQHVHHPVEHVRRRTIDRFEGDGGAAAGHRERAAGGATAGT